MAAGTSYATHGEPMIPIYTFYSMFGFQRTGDEFWAAADQMTRGFLLGATAGRTTLNGEGLQHQDGHSLLLASTNPACVAYDAEPRRTPYVTTRLREAPGPVVAVSDWMRAVPDQIAPFVPGEWSSLGTDGFGLSDTRGALRRHFTVDAPSIVVRVLEQLADRDEVDGSVPSQAFQRYRLDDVAAAAPTGNNEGPSE